MTRIQSDINGLRNPVIQMETIMEAQNFGFRPFHLGLLTGQFYWALLEAHVFSTGQLTRAVQLLNNGFPFYFFWESMDANGLSD